MIHPRLYKQYEKIALKWRLYRTLRYKYPEKCIVGTEHFLDWRQREQMFEDLLTIIENAND
jgi:hypothetical protein